MAIKDFCQASRRILVILALFEFVGAVNCAESTNETERYHLVTFDFPHVEVPYVICLWILLASVAKIGFHLYNRLSSYFPESCLLIVLGITTGLILHYSRAASTDQYVLNANTFFIFILPPIIYDAGYHMPNRAFFNNLGTILLLAFVNTLWNTVAIGVALWGCSAVGWIQRPISMLHCFVFSALISAVDPVAVLAVFEEIHVNEMLYIIVFGESLLNDGVTVVVYHMMEGYTEIGEANIEAIDIVAGIGSFFIIAIGGTVIGIIYGLIGGFITKYTGHVRVIEPLFVFVLGFLAYLTAEMLHWSGILALTFGGITMRHYVECNMSKSSTQTVKYFMKMLANVSETIIFLFLGLSTVIETHDWQLDFIFFSILFCIIFRVIGIVVLSFIVNRTRLIRLSKIDQFIMSYGGLRGGIAFCLALLLHEDVVHEKRMFVTTTILVVFFTVFLQGITIKPVVNALKVERSKPRDTTMNERLNERVIDHLMAGIEDIVGRSGHNSLRHKFEHYNTKYIKPLLLREKPKSRETKIFQVFTKLNLRDAEEHISAHGAFLSPAMLKEPSLAQVMGLNSESADSFSIAPDLVGNKQRFTVLDMQSLDAVYTKKQADESRMHRLLEHSMFRPRKTWVKEMKHTLTEVHNHPPFHHKERYQLRRLISQAYRVEKKKCNGLLSSKEAKQEKPKSITFSNDSVSADKTDPREVSPTNTDNNKVVFTVGPDDTDQNKCISPSPSSVSNLPGTPQEETEVERVLPWKRITANEPMSSLVSLCMPDDENPLMAEVPSWVSNPSYHNLKESGSPFASPQTTVTAPPQQEHISLFEVFPSNTEEQKMSSIPAPWECKQTDEEPVTSSAVNHTGVKTDYLLHSSHCFIPPPQLGVCPDEDVNGDERKPSSVLPGKASSPQSPKHWQPIEMQQMLKKSSSEAQIILDEMDYQQQAQSRVEEWLHHHNDSENYQQETQSPDQEWLHHHNDSDIDNSYL